MFPRLAHDYLNLCVRSFTPLLVNLRKTGILDGRTLAKEASLDNILPRGVVTTNIFIQLVQCWGCLLSRGKANVSVAPVSQFSIGTCWDPLPHEMGS